MSKITLLEYCQSKEMTIAKFAKLTGVSQSHLYKIQVDRGANLTVDNARKIYNSTLEKFGIGLDVWEYLDR